MSSAPAIRSSIGPSADSAACVCARRSPATVAPSFKRRARWNIASTCARAGLEGSSGTSSVFGSPLDQSVTVSDRAPRGARAASATSHCARCASVSASPIRARSPRTASALRARRAIARFSARRASTRRATSASFAESPARPPPRASQTSRSPSPAVEHRSASAQAAEPTVTSTCPPREASMRARLLAPPLEPDASRPRAATRPENLPSLPSDAPLRASAGALPTSPTPRPATATMNVVTPRLDAPSARAERPPTSARCTTAPRRRGAGEAREARGASIGGSITPSLLQPSRLACIVQPGAPRAPSPCAPPSRPLSAVAATRLGRRARSS